MAKKQTDGQFSLTDYVLPEARIRIVPGEDLISEESLTTANKVAELMMKFMEDKDREYLVVINQNVHLKPISYSVVSIGGIRSALVPMPNIFKTAILQNAAYITLCHNHPGGEPMPSQKDIDLTKKAVKAGKLLEIPVIDHIITAGNRCVSLRDSKLFKL